MKKLTPDIAGHRFRRLIVIERVGSKCLWRCRCDCGNEKSATGGQLRAGLVASCGCLARERRTANGMWNSPEYSIWRGVIERCRNPRGAAYPRYGGRGIKVCERWVRFSNFYADMGAKPFPRASVERLNADGDYGPDNCRWATHVEQANNRSNNRLMTKDGRTQTLSQWAAELKMARGTLVSRLHAGWSDERALAAPVSNRGWSAVSRRRFLPFAGAGEGLILG